MAQKITLPGSQDQDPIPQKNLLIAFGLMGIAIFGMQYFTPAPAPAPQKPAAQTRPAEKKQDAAPATVAASTPAAPNAPANSPAAVTATKEEITRVETDLYRVQFSNKGGVVQSWILKKFKDSKGQPLQLAPLGGTDKFGYPFAIQLNGKELQPNLNWYLYNVKQSSDGLNVEFEYAAGNNRSKKSFQFQKDKYLVQVNSELSLNGAPLEHNLAWRGGFGDQHAYNAFGLGQTVRLLPDKSSPDIKSAKDADGAWSTDIGNFVFAGLQDQFFAAVAVNRSGKSLELQTTSDRYVAPASTDNAEVPNIGMGIGGAAKNELLFFIGPKDYHILGAVDPRLDKLVDFGTWFGIVAKPLFYALNWVNDNYVHNYGWSIIAVTIIINLLTLPLKLSSMKSMQQTAIIQPEIQRINEKYKGVSMTDPKAAQKNEELMALYKKHNVNPAGGCLPLFLQMPFLIGFYSVLSVAIEMRQAQWLWVSDLSQPETLPVRLLPVAMVITQFLLQKMTPSAGMDPQQQRIMLLMPLMFAFMFYGASSGLVLYWLTGNVFAMAQQYIYMKLSPPKVTPPSQAVVNVKKKK
jgi:YidC/Oxa1 family membrane protein insertase